MRRTLPSITTSCLGVLTALWAASCSKRDAAPEPVSAPGLAQATGPLDIPMMAPRLVATLEQTHFRFQYAPETDAGLGYEVLVPKDWKFTKPSSVAAPAGGPLDTVALGDFTGPPALGSPAIIMSTTMPRFEIPLDTMLRESFSRSGYTIVAGHWIPGVHGLYFEATGTRIRDGAQQVRRTSARADGGHIFLVTCLVPRAHWDEVKDTCWVAHDGFTVQKATGESQLEPWLTARGRRPNFRVAYPASWSATPVEPAPEDVAAVDLRLTNPAKDRLLAYCQIKVQRLEKGEAVPPLDRLAGRAVEKLAALRFSTSGAPVPLTGDDDPRAAAVAGWLGGFVVNGHLASSDATARLGFAQRNGFLTTWLLLGPTAHDDLVVALRAQRAFEMARATAEAN